MNARGAEVQMTEAEYLASERAAQMRHEFHDGRVYAMAGATEAHVLIAANMTGELRSALRDRPCRVYSSDMKVKIESAGLYTYPDVTVACGDRRFVDERKDTLLNPAVVIEVLSESTESYDRGQKFEWYRTVPSITDVLLVSQDRPIVEQYTRQADGTWVLHELRIADTLVIASLDCRVPVAEVYLKVFPESETQPAP